jgi:hypothetical protein
MKETTKSILSDVLLDEEAIPGLLCLRSMKSILNKIFRSCAGRISVKKRIIVNTLMACILNKDKCTISTTSIGKHAGLSKHCISYNKAKSFQTARLIKAGDERGFKLIEPEKHCSKYPLETVEKFEQWIIKDCELVIQNPLKNDMIYERDRMGKVVMGEDNHPIKIQKVLLMSSY